MRSKIAIGVSYYNAQYGKLYVYAMCVFDTKYHRIVLGGIFCNIGYTILLTYTPFISEAT